MPRILIVGGGYAGVRCAQRLAAMSKGTWEITLLDRNPFHQLLTRLPEVVGGTLAPQLAKVPFATVLGHEVRTVVAEVLDVDTHTRTVTTSVGRLSAEWLLVSAGTWPHFLGIAGAATYGNMLKSVAHAEVLHRRVEKLLAQRRDVRIVVIGSGYTGTEVAGELVEWGMRIRQSATHRPIEVTIVSMDSRLMADANPSLGAVAANVLAQKGVHLRLGVAVQEVTSECVRLRDEVSVPADLVIWAAHSQAALPANHMTVRTGRDDRLLVDPYLRLPESPQVYASGDVALTYDYVHNRVDAASAQIAVQEGAIAAHNIAAEIRGGTMREFRPRTIGEVLSLGGKDAAAEIAGVFVSGGAALALKRAALVRYLYQLGGSRLVARYLG